MANNRKVLEDTITLLMSVTPDTPLGQLLNLCLVAKADADISQSARELAAELLEDPAKIAYWTINVIGSDADYTPEEWKALDVIDLDDVDAFWASFNAELESLNLD